MFNTKEKFKIPIICVGNIYIGGTGKTPLSIELLKILKKFYKKPVFIIAEVGINHNGSYQIAKKLVDVAKQAGAEGAVRGAEGAVRGTDAARADGV